MDILGFIILLIVAHFFGDFVLQDRETALKKSSSWIALTKHFIQVFFGMTLVVWVVGLFFFPYAELLFLTGVVFLYSIVHCIQDRYIWRGYKWLRRKEDDTFKYWEDTKFYDTIGLDQALHLITLVAILKWLPKILWILL